MTVLPTKRPHTELAHLAWCIMVAVSLARQEGKARSALQTHRFIMEWLSTAQKRKLFPKSLAHDILWMQAQGKQHGLSARLYSKLEYVWLASSEELASQSTLFRFTCMIDTLRTMGWQDYLLSDSDWQSGWKAGSSIPTIYTQKSLLQTSFTECGKLVTTLELRFTGELSGLMPLLAQCHLNAESQPDVQGYRVLRVQPGVTDTE